MSLTPEHPAHSESPGRVCADTDWTSVDHAICIRDADGHVMERFFVVHDAAGLRLKALVRRLLKTDLTADIPL
jgi:hypothetical protein